MITTTISCDCCGVPEGNGTKILRGDGDTMIPAGEKIFIGLPLGKDYCLGCLGYLVANGIWPPRTESA